MDNKVVDKTPQRLLDNETFTTHPPLSPPTPAESFFLPQLRSNEISAFALAAQIRGNKAHSAVSGTTDDFYSTTSREDHFEDLLLTRSNSNRCIPEDQDLQENNMMSSTTATTTISVTPTLPKEELTAPTSDAAVEAGEHYDVSRHVYEGAKNVWAFGKGIGFVRPFLGLAEGVASKLVGVVGADLEAVDHEIIKPLQGIDNILFNPVIGTVVGLAAPVVKTADSVVRPIVTAIAPKIFGPFGLFIEDGETASPESNKSEAMTQTVTSS